MAIRREVDWFGLVIWRSTPTTGFQERLRMPSLIFGKHDCLAVVVEQPNTLNHSTDLDTMYGNRALVGWKFDVKYFETSAQEINDREIGSRRNLLGFTTKIRWYESPK